MTLIDRYILTTWIKVYLICYISLAGLYVVIDAFSNLDELLRYGPAHGGVLVLLAKYYAPRLLTFFDYTSGILAVIASLFTLVWLQSTQELTALVAAGIRKGRIVAPLIVAAMVVAAIATVNRELLIPEFRGPLSRNFQDLDGTAARKVQPQWDLETNLQINGQNSFAKRQEIDKPRIQLPQELASYGSALVAERGLFRAAEGDRPAGILLEEVTRPAGADKRASAKIGEKTIIYSPSDTPWLKPKELFVVTNIHFELLSANALWRQLAATTELVAGLANPSLDYGPDVRLAVHRRLLKPLVDMTLLLLGLPLILGGENRNVWWAIALCLLIIGAYFGVELACHSAGTHLLVRAPLAAWIPLLIFLPIAAFLSEPMRNE
jgi:lipopolysaccharide export system permease protein